MMFVFRSAVLFILVFPAIDSELVDFSKCREFFFEGLSPVIPGILENSTPQIGRYKTICQKQENSYRFATFYDTRNRIPVFSAYKFTAAANISRIRDGWMIEPQLELLKDEMGMSYENQAMDEDYYNNTCNVDRGHLFPSCHSPDQVFSRSTFTLTNTVPQKQSFNEGSWNRMEIKTKDMMGNYCRDEMDQNNVLAHVLTGAVPGNSKLKERVNIPSFMWMTFCCYNISSESWISQAYWAPNEDENKADNIKIAEINLQELQNSLSTKWVKITQLFNNNCKK
ncbi:endonuclease domain-containing 1 protein-like [Triplophysa dalaica]|uniref:endonuclease domain-containing 1 protein-like n=1 Tax=Triplophysa dalaica TaxID=1582913 RepID=UPI0024DFF120|nr:endonuclease domain-containing 1 protein-like [Triplophysa dalaica]